MTKHPKQVPVERDEWERPVVYLAEYRNGPFGGSGIFTSKQAAIFYVVTGLGYAVDWTDFPDPKLKYPYEERDGNDEKNRDPLFVVKRNNCEGTVTRTAAMESWIVGNGIATKALEWYRKATGKDEVELAGVGEQLHATVKAPDARP